MSMTTTSRVWSCNTLNDGVDQLLAEANRIEDEELQLEKMIQDRKTKYTIMQYLSSVDL